MVRCCSGDQCILFHLPVFINKHACAQCKHGLHLPCASRELDEALPPYDHICLMCSPVTPKKVVAPALVTTTPLPVDLTDQPSGDQTQPATSRFQQIGNKRYRIPLIDGKEYHPKSNSFRYLDEPHPFFEGLVTSPFSAVGQGKTSPIWIFYSTKIKDLAANLTTKVGQNQVCNLCGATPCMGKDFSPTPLKRHIEIHHLTVFNHVVKNIWKESTNGISTSSLIKQHLVPRISVEAARGTLVTAVARFIVHKNLPFNTSEDKEFRRLLRKTAELGSRLRNFNIGRDAVADEIKEMSGEVRSLLVVSVIGEVMHSTSDHWTSRGNINFGGCTMQHITDEVTLIQRDLSCDEFHGSSSGEHIFNQFISDMANEWGCTPSANEKIYVPPANCRFPSMGVAVTDTASNMNKFGLLLEDKSAAGHVYCTDHVLQLTAQKAYNHSFLKTPRELSDNPASEAKLLVKLRQLVALFNSTQKTEKLLSKQESMDIYANHIPVVMVQDVVTRWWSTYDMCERALYLRPALTAMDMNSELRSSDDPVNRASRCPTATEWESLEQLSLLLKPFKAAQQTLEANQYVTSSLVHFLCQCIEEHLDQFMIPTDDPPSDLEDHQEPADGLQDSIVELAGIMLEDFQSRWGNLSRPWPKDGVVLRGRMRRQVGVHPNLLIATAVDPRFKAMSKIDEDQQEEIKSHLLIQMVIAKKQLLAKKQVLLSTTEKASTPMESLKKKPRLTRKAATRGFHGRNVFSVYAVTHAAAGAANARGNDQDLEDECKLELQRFFAADGIPICKDTEDEAFEDPLPWWKVNKTVFPTVWLIAKYHLGIPATSANAERCFSYTNKLISAHRAGMSTKASSNSFLVKRNFDCLPFTPEKK
jgi:hypothetical protein